MPNFSSVPNTLYIILTSLFFYCSCSSPTTSATTKDNLEQRAYQAYDKNEYEKAIPLFDSLILNDSTKGELYYKRGYSYFIKKSTTPMDSVINAIKQKGYSSFKEAENAPAIKDFLKAISLGYKKKSYLNLGVIYTFINDSIALDYFTKSLHEDPNYEKAKHEIELCKMRIQNNEHFY